MQTPADSLERIVLDASLRALSEQEAGLRDLRARAGTLLAASALTVSFLGTQTLDRDGLSLVTWLGIGAFVMSLLATVHVLLPEAKLSFSIDASRVYRELWPLQDDLMELQREVARWATRRHLDNQPLLDALGFSYRLAAFALLVQAGLWTVGLSPIV
jgi:hypothetical protein